MTLQENAKFRFDWLLGAAFIAAPFCWWLLSITVAPTSTPELSDILSQRFIVVAIVYPVLEEIAFRGVLQGWLLKQNWGVRRWYGVSNANIVASMLFTTLHLVRRISVLSLAVFVPSLVFGFFRERYNNLYVPIALHIFYNAGIVLLFV